MAQGAYLHFGQLLQFSSLARSHNCLFAGCWSIFRAHGTPGCARVLHARHSSLQGKIRLTTQSWYALLYKITILYKYMIVTPAAISDWLRPISFPVFPLYLVLMQMWLRRKPSTTQISAAATLWYTLKEQNYSAIMVGCYIILLIIIWLLHNLVEASFDLFRSLLLGDQLSIAHWMKGN